MTSYTTDESEYYVLPAFQLEKGDFVFENNSDSTLILRGIVQDTSFARAGTFNLDLKDYTERLPRQIVHIVFYNPLTRETWNAYLDNDESFSIIRPSQVIKDKVE